MENTDLNNKSNSELIEITQSTEDKEVLRAVAEKVEASYSGNSGVTKLKENILAKLNKNDENEDEDEENAPDPVLMAALEKQKAEDEAEKAKAPKKDKKPKEIMKMSRTAQSALNPRAPGLTEPEKRAIVRAKALRLHRVRVTNMDPNDSSLPGAIRTIWNKYTGKVSRYIPFGEENNVGYHIEECLLEDMKQQTYNLRKEIKGKGSSIGVKQYKTVQMKKFSIEYLDDLTAEELHALGQDQKARGALDAQD